MDSLCCVGMRVWRMRTGIWSAGYDIMLSQDDVPERISYPDARSEKFPPRKAS